jgi:3-mercaptopyruvate sulfurtransferase SseA
LEPNRTWKSAEALRALLDAAGVTPDREVITY